MAKRVYCAFLIAAISLSAAKLLAQGNAGQAGEFLRWGVGSKALGMGRAFTSVADDASALYWNPAGLSALSKVGGSFMVMHVPMREGASFNYLAGAIPLRLFFINSDGTKGLVNFVQDLKLGVGVLWHSLGDFEFYNEDGSRASGQTENSIGQSAVYVSVSYPLTRFFRGIEDGGVLNAFKGELHFGLTTKLVNQDLFGFSGSATSFDLGLKYSHYSGMFDLGFSWRDLNKSTISYSGDVLGDRIPATGLLGVSLRPSVGALHGLMLAFDYGLVKPRARDRDVMFGAEYDFSKVSPQLPIKLRVGANSNYESITFGISFSPEDILGQDWAPSGDYTFASGRSGFDATGGRISFSVDRNPFTAKYWYEKAMQHFPVEGTTEAKAADPVTSEQYLRNAQESKNPGSRAYRYEATLRQADLAFYEAVTEFQSAKMDDMVVVTEATNTLKRVQNLYTSQASKYLREDYGKTQLDLEAYFNSFVNHVQSLVLSGNSEQAVALCKERGQSWGKMIDVLRGGNGSYDLWVQRLNYLHAFALYRGHSVDEAKTMLHDQLSNDALASYIFSHISFLEGDYEGAYESLKHLSLNDTHFPPNLHLPLMQDRNFGDEVLFLRAASIYKMSGLEAADDFIAEFAKIPRFLPRSDLAAFLTYDEGVLFKLVDHFEKGEDQELEQLVQRMIHSYVRTFSNGMLKEDIYTHNLGG